MPEKLDLYNAAYSRYEADVYRDARIETYGQDLGQTSWMTAEESAEIPRTLRLTKTSHVLDVGCGSGRYALQVAETTGCRILGVDINEAGIRTAGQLAAARSVSGRAQFQICDVSKPLHFGDAQFDAIFSNDVLCHVPGRRALLRELFRVLRTGGRLLFSDALVIGGLISHQEIATRSSVGYYLFSPPGENERMITEAGFRLLSAADSTKNAALIAQRWHDARERRRAALVALESEASFDGLQRFFSCVSTLSNEHRLLRFLYVAEKVGES
jgi:SAM-dependent methyltransferase